MNPNKNKAGKYSVLMRVTVNRIHKRKKLPFFLDRKSQFTAKAKPNSFGLLGYIVNHKNSDQYNKIIHKWKERVFQNYHSVLEKLDREATLDELLNLKSTSISVGKFFTEIAIENISADSFKSANYRYNKFVHWLNENHPNCMMDSLGFTIANAYALYLKRNMQPSSARSHLKYLRSAFNLALRGEYIQSNPFVKIKLPKVEKKEVTRLTSEQIRQMINLNLSDEKSVEIARDTFLIQYFLCGKRIGDTLKLKFSMIKGEELHTRISKSKKYAAAHIPKIMFDVINKYRVPDKNTFILPYLRGYESASEDVLRRKVESSSAMVNLKLKVIQKYLNIEGNLITHSARYSLGFRHQIELNRSKDSLQLLYNHSNMRVTEGYIGTELDKRNAIKESKIIFKDFLIDAGSHSQN
ncbi:phage integrase SAM-like domain-containing protein [Flavobacteriales bacterium]|nr:phage integrase SAM-like domain-containing protein [Flavobacteriales bacterium]